MTLVLTLAAENEFHMTCDFKLTDANTGRPISVDAQKLVTVGPLSGLQAVVGITGIAKLNRQTIGDWIAERTTALGQTASFDTLVSSLRGDASDALADLPKRIWTHRRITFVIAAIEGSQAVIGLLSNFQILRGIFLSDKDIPSHELRLDVVRPSSPRLVVAGDGVHVRKEERKNLERLLRAGAKPDVIREQMAEINRRVASRSNFVSAGCYAATELATGRGQTVPFLVEQTGEFMPPDVEALFKKAGVTIGRVPKPGEKAGPLRLRQAASTKYKASPSYFREQFKLRPNDSDLWNNFGVYEVNSDRLDEGRRAYERALQLNPRNYTAARNLGFILWGRYSERDAGMVLIKQAAEEAPDENFRRETTSMLAEALAQKDGNSTEARKLYEASLQGRELIAPSARWASFMWQYLEGRSDDALALYRHILEKDPNCIEAISGSAMCIWLVQGASEAARGIVESALRRLPDNSQLIATALYLALVDEEVDAAEVLLRRLQRDGSVARTSILTFTSYFELCAGRDLSKIVSSFREATGREDVVYLAAVLWAQAAEEECGEILASLDFDTLSVDARSYVTFLEELLRRGTSEGRRPPHTRLEMRDTLLFKALSVHPEVPAERRAQISDVLRGTVNR